MGTSQIEYLKDIAKPFGPFVFSSRPGRQCGHPEDAPDVSAEPRVAFPADCASSRPERKAFKQGKGDFGRAVGFESVKRWKSRMNEHVDQVEEVVECRIYQSISRSNILERLNLNIKIKKT